MTNDHQIYLLVPRAHVKTVKSALESKNLLDRRVKISPEKKVNGGIDLEGDRMVIPITLKSIEEFDAEQLSREWTAVEKKEKVLETLRLEGLANKIDITLSNHSKPRDRESKHCSPLFRALEEAVGQLPEGLLTSLGIAPGVLINAFPTTYSLYKPMLLLPPQTFSSPHWTKLFSECPPNSPTLEPVWKSLARSMGATHIAVNASIPLSTGPDKREEAEYRMKENILRSPVNLTPIFGYFGPPPTQALQSYPTKQDFENAFWVSTCQNGIHQVWAPLYTMFSRGNIREKTRLLELPCIQTCISQGKETEKGVTAVDLYSGIGYFAFSYKKARVSKVLCWELNPWSIEGLRRGAQLNSWSTQIVDPTQDGKIDWSESRAETLREDFLVFQQSNEYALDTVTELRSRVKIPSIRHVNCGFLPSSQTSWRIAACLLDRQITGWIHVHENVGTNDTERRKGEVVAEVQRYVDDWKEGDAEERHGRRNAICEHVERVKTYAPGVVHVVFDIRVEVA